MKNHLRQLKITFVCLAFVLLCAPHVVLADAASDAAAAAAMSAVGGTAAGGLAGPAAAAAAGSAATTAAPKSIPGLHLVLQPCITTGNCTLDDLVTQGASVANFFTALSAALFFFTFVYGGARYLLSFGRADWVSAGTKAMTGAAIGMAIVMGAWVIVNYVADSLQGK